MSNGRKLAEVASRLDLHAATITRWILSGVRLKDGRRLKLPATRYPGHWTVTDEAIEEFLAALTRDRVGDADSPLSAGADAAPLAARTTSARRRAVEAADRELERIGI